MSNDKLDSARPREQLQEMIRNLNKEERIRLVALAWIRRGMYRANEWKKALREATAECEERTVQELIDLAYPEN
jgi:hypothetical protein